MSAPRAQTPRSPTSAPPAFAGSGSSAPTPQFNSHYEVLPPQVDAGAFRQGWLVRSRALALFESREIDGQEYAAMLWWRRAVERLGRVPVQRWMAHIDHSRQPGDGVTAAELTAAGELRAAGRALGSRRVGLLLAVTLDRSWHDIGRQLGVSSKTAKARAVEAIAALAYWKAGKPVPPPPRERFRNQPGSW